MKALTVILIVALLWSTMPTPCVGAASEVVARPEVLARGAADTHVYRISMAEFRQIEPLLREQETRGTVVIAQLAELVPRQTSGAAETGSGRAVTDGVASNAVSGAINGALGTATNHVSEPLPGEGVPRYAPGQSLPPSVLDDGTICNGFFDLTHDLWRSDWPNGDAAIVIFVVIGVTVVLAVVVYAGAFLYDMATGVGERVYWWDVEAQTSILCSGGNSGYLAGAKLSSGFENKEAKVGLVVEGGRLDAEIHLTEATDPVTVEGAFAMVGAAVRWALGGLQANPSFVGFELLAGTASDDNVHLMSTARANLSFGLGSRTRLGVSLGALYMGLEATDGLVRDADNFTTLVGVQAGYRF